MNDDVINVINSATELGNERVCNCPPGHGHVLMIDEGPPKAAVLLCREFGCENLECFRKEAQASDRG